MRVSALDLLITTAMLMGMATTDPLPEPVGDTSNCDPISKYSIQWFVDNWCTEPPASKCLFYTSGLSFTAQDYAKNNDLITIWVRDPKQTGVFFAEPRLQNIWAPIQYSRDNVQENPLRCIMLLDKDRLDYFMFMSTAMAALCDVYAQVMTETPSAVNLDGYFGQYEFPTMRRGGRVKQIDAVNLDGSVKRQFWSSSSSRSKRFAPDYHPVRGETTFCNGAQHNETAERSTLVKRDVCGADADAAAAFDICGDFQIPW